MSWVQAPSPALRRLARSASKAPISALLALRASSTFLTFKRSPIMADETETPTPEAPTTEGADEGAEKTEEKKKVKQTVEIKDIGPCKKHIKVTVDRADIEASLSDKYKNLVGK